MTELFNKSNYIGRRRHLRKTMPKGEYMLWQALRNRAHEYKFRRQYSIGSYIIDIYCPKVSLAIEVDGLTHFNDIQSQRDNHRQKYIEDKGITVLRFTSYQVFNELYDVIGKILFTCHVLQYGFPAENPLTSP